MSVEAFNDKYKDYPLEEFYEDNRKIAIEMNNLRATLGGSGWPEFPVEEKRGICSWLLELIYK